MIRIKAIQAITLMIAAMPIAMSAEPIVQLPDGVKAVWNLDKALREKSATRERICLNGLWRWQPGRNEKGLASPDNPVAADAPIPESGWGFFKVPGCWPGIGDYLQKETQTVFAHPSWKADRFPTLNAAWHQREITIPADWAGRRITLQAEQLNSFALIYVDGKKAGKIQFPGGEADITALCKPGEKQLLSILVHAAPLSDVKLLFADTNTAPQDAKKVKARVDRRGFCGDVYLAGAPAAARIEDVRVATSVRNGEISVDAALQGLAAGADYTVKVQILENGTKVHEFSGAAFKAAALKDGRISVNDKWKAPKLWDIHTPQNMYELQVTLESGGKPVDVSLAQRFGFREFWIDGKDFYLNGSRIFLSAIGMSNGVISASAASYAAAKESFERMKGFGINLVYTNNFGCEPGAHLSYSEVFRAADDSGVLVTMTQPHFGQYDWKAADAEATNGYAGHAEFYVHQAASHPSVVFYSMSHNATGYNEDMDPDQIDGKYERRQPWAKAGAERAQRAEAIVRKLDPSRIVYHHSSGNLGVMHNMNFYANFTPVQELCDWFQHWAKDGIKPLYTCEYGAPFAWDWTMYRGWYWNEKHQWVRNFGSAVAPWEFCMAEWNSQFLGDRAFKISDFEKANLRWEGQKMKEGKLWHRWDYPSEVGSRRFSDRYDVLAQYLTDNFRAYRTLGVSAISPWEHSYMWKTRDGFNRKRKELPVDWENLQRPGFSADYIDDVYDDFVTAHDRNDWVTTPASDALIRNLRPLLTYIAGPAAHVTSKEHNYFAGEAVEKQLVVINNSRETVTCECEWSLKLPQALSGTKTITLKTGEQERIPVRFELPASATPGAYEMSASVRFGNGETQKDAFAIHVVAKSEPSKADAKLALFDPKGETAKSLGTLGVKFQTVDAAADLAAFDTLIVGKGALTLDGKAPDISRVRDGLKVILFEQTSAVLEKRFGFRVAEYGLRNAYPRVPDHPLLQGLKDINLHDWRGDATLLPASAKFEMNDNKFNGSPMTKWAGIEVTRIWRAGCRGNVASVLIEKPACGNFLPIIDGGFSLQYSPLMEYREGKGMVVFCQMDVSGRSENEPAAEILTGNILNYVAAWKPAAERKAVYIGDAEGKTHLEKSGIAVTNYGDAKVAPGSAIIVGAGGGQKLAAESAGIAQFIKDGGRILTMGLDEGEANAFLPSKVGMKKAEHIAAFFDPQPHNSALEGVGSADVHNRDPRQMPLVTGGATPLGDGVLATSENGSVVLDQMAPWQFKYTVPQNTKRTFRRASFTLTRILGNLGVSGKTPLLERFSKPVDEKTEKRWLDGFYLDQPEEWDDPYRFFRW